MSCEIKEVHKDALTINGFTLEIEGTPFISISKCTGPNRQIGELLKADGGTGKLVKFSDGVINFGDWGFTRWLDPSNQENQAISQFVTDSICEGTKHDAVLIKWHHGKEVGRVTFTGLLFKQEQYPDLDKAGSGAFEVVVTCGVDYWEAIL